MFPVSRKDIAAAGALALAVAVVFWQVAGFDYLMAWDDKLYIVQNPFVTSGVSWDNLVSAFTSFERGAIWAPLLWVSFQLDVTLMGGLTSHGMHVEQVGLHALNAVLAYWLFYRLSGRRWLAAVVALLWAVHPAISLESVAWVTERKNTLSQVFFLGALLSYLGYCEKASWGRYLGFVALTLAAYLVKPSTVMLPVLMLALGYLVKGRRDYVRLGLEQAPLLGFAVVVGLFTIHAEQAGHSLATTGTPTLALYALAVYLKQLVWPVGLSYFYQVPGEDYVASAAGGLALLGMVWAIGACRVRRPLVSFGLAWFLLGFVLVCGYPMQVGGAVHSERFIYLPMAGLLLAVVAALPARLVPVLAFLTLPLGYLTWTHAPTWANDNALMANAAQVNPYDPLMVQWRIKSLPLNEQISVIQEARHEMRSLNREDYLVLAWMLAPRLEQAGRPMEAADVVRQALRSEPVLSSFYIKAFLPYASRFDLPEYQAEVRRISLSS